MADVDAATPRALLQSTHEIVFESTPPVSTRQSTRQSTPKNNTVSVLPANSVLSFRHGRPNGYSNGHHHFSPPVEPSTQPTQPTVHPENPAAPKVWTIVGPKDHPDSPPLRPKTDVDMAHSNVSLPSRETQDTDRTDDGTSTSSSCSSDLDSDISEDVITQKNRERFPPLLPAVSTGPHLLDPRARRQQAEDIAERLARLEAEIRLSRTSGSSGGPAEDLPSQDEVSRLWLRLQEQRQKTKRLRREMTGRREEIQTLRHDRDMADNAFMRAIRPRMVSGAGSRNVQLPIEIFTTLFDELQTCRTNCNFAESQYEKLEADLDREENHLQVIETEFFSQLYGATGAVRRAAGRGGSGENDEESEDDENGAVPPSRASLMGISGDRPDDVHPLYQSLLDAVGDRNLAREHYTELVNQRDAILYNLEMRLMLERNREEQPTVTEDELRSLKSAISSRLDADEFEARFSAQIKEDEMEFLQEYDVEEKVAREKLDETNREVIRLRNLCIEMGVMRKNPTYHEEYSIFADIDGGSGTNSRFETSGSGGVENVSLDPERPPTAASVANPLFPLLLTNPQHLVTGKEPRTARAALREATRMPTDDPDRPRLLEECIKEYGISTMLGQVAAENKSDYINRWLLHRLRISPMEVELLHSVFSNKLKVVNPRRWQADVLYFWPRDDANLPAETFDGPVTSRDDLEIDEENTAGVNWDIYPPSRPGSERPASGRGNYRGNNLRATMASARGARSDGDLDNQYGEQGARHHHNRPHHEDNKLQFPRYTSRLFG